MEKSVPDGLYDVPIESGDYQMEAAKPILEVSPNIETQKDISALGLLALNYGNSSDSEEDQTELHTCFATDETNSGDYSSESTSQCIDSSSLSFLKQDYYSGANASCGLSFPGFGPENETPIEVIDPYWGRGCTYFSTKDISCNVFGNSDELEANKHTMVKLNNMDEINIDPRTLSHVPSRLSLVAYNDERIKLSDTIVSGKKPKLSFPMRTNEDSSRMHVFCLEHAVEVQQQLRPIGGVHILLVCNPDYPKVEAEAKLLAEEMGVDYLWNDTEFRDATKEDSDRIQSVLACEEAIPGNLDWAVKLGINLFYSAILSRSPLYSKQMPYNSVIYNAFGHNSPANTPIKPSEGKGIGKQKKIVMAGKWCGKVWMSNQVHPFLVSSDLDEQVDRRFNTWAPSERILESTCKADTRAASRKSGNKRKKTEENQSIKKLKNPKLEDLKRALDDSRDIDSYKQNRRVLRSSEIKENVLFETKLEQNNVKFASSVDGDFGGPSTRLRKRTPKAPSKDSKANGMSQEQQVGKKKMRKAPVPSPEVSVAHKAGKKNNNIEEYQCDIEGCAMSLCSKHGLMLHKQNICPVRGCGKKFFSHKYLLQHRRVHDDDRPLKCPWRGCTMTFKWAWARTEHIRVHTGARPYVCSVLGCGQTFRFVSDFSRHKRKTGHSVKKKGRG